MTLQYVRKVFTDIAFEYAALYSKQKPSLLLVCSVYPVQEGMLAEQWGSENADA